MIGQNSSAIQQETRGALPPATTPRTPTRAVRPRLPIAVMGVVVLLLISHAESFMTISMVAALNPRGHFRDIPITDGYNATTGPLSIENAYRVNNADDSFVATCIASDLGGREDISMIGGYVSDSNHSMVFKIASNSTVRWMTPIPFSSSASNVSESKTKSMVLGCTGDSSGDLYVVTASNASTFDGLANTRQVGQFGLFLSKLSGTNGARYWTSALNCTNDGADDALDVTWDFDTNRVLIFGQMYAMAFPSVEKRPRLLRLEAGCGERLSALTDIVFAPASKTIASRVVVGDSHHIFVGYRSSVKVYNVEKTCNQTSCFSCYVSLFDISYLQRATVVTSDTYNCHGIALSVDRVTRYVVVYMDISMSTTPQNKFVLLQVYEVTQSDSGFFGLTLFGTGTLGTSYTSIGAVFIQNYQILVSGVTSTNITDNSIGFMSPQSFIGQLQIGSARESPWINDVKYLPRISNPNIEESRISGMTWSAKSSRVMVLTTTNEVPDGAIDAPTWLAATLPNFLNVSSTNLTMLPSYISYRHTVYPYTACPTTTTTTFTATTTMAIISTTVQSAPISSPTSTRTPTAPPAVDESPFLPIISGLLGVLLLCTIGIISRHLYMRRRQRLLHQPRDKEQQFKTRHPYESNDAIARSSNMLFTGRLNAESAESPAHYRTGSGKLTRTAANSSQDVLNAKNYGRVEPANKTGVQQFSDIAASLGSARSLNRPFTTSVAMNAMPTRSSVSKSPLGKTVSASDASAPKTQNTVLAQRTLLYDTNTGKGMVDLLHGDSVFQKPAPSWTGDTTIVSGPSAALSLTTTTMISTQKAMSIPGFLEMQDGIDFTLGKELARGGGGAVYLGEARNHEIIRMAGSKQIVVKRVFENTDNLEESDNTFFQEVAIMWLLSGRNTARIVGFCSTPKSILMKFYPCGSLSDLIHFQSKKPKLAPIRYDVGLALRLATDVACGVTEIHKEGLFHSDLKPPNVLLDIDEQGVLYAVITDFGVTQVVKYSALLVKAFRVSKTAGASPCYAAPELLDHQLVTVRTPTLMQAADTFSFAVILAELMMRMAPWQTAKSIDEVIQGVIAGERAYRRPLNFGGQEFHQRVASLVERCWAQAPRARPEMHAAHAELLLALENMPRG